MKPVIVIRANCSFAELQANSGHSSPTKAKLNVTFRPARRFNF